MVEFFFECVPHGLKGCRWVPQSWWRPRWRCSCRLTRPTHWKTPQMCIHVSGQHPRTKDSQKKNISFQQLHRFPVTQTDNISVFQGNKESRMLLLTGLHGRSEKVSYIIIYKCLWLQLRPVTICEWMTSLERVSFVSAWVSSCFVSAPSTITQTTHSQCGLPHQSGLQAQTAK